MGAIPGIPQRELPARSHEAQARLVWGPRFVEHKQRFSAFVPSPLERDFERRLVRRFNESACHALGKQLFEAIRRGNTNHVLRQALGRGTNSKVARFGVAKPWGSVGQRPHREHGDAGFCNTRDAFDQFGLRDVESIEQQCSIMPRANRESVAGRPRAGEHASTDPIVHESPRPKRPGFL